MDQQTIERDADALGWGKQLNLGDTLFKYLADGDEFTFADRTVTYTKLNKDGWYKTSTGRRCKCRTRTAVFAKGTA